MFFHGWLRLLSTLKLRDKLFIATRLKLASLVCWIHVFNAVQCTWQILILGIILKDAEGILIVYLCKWSDDLRIGNVWVSHPDDLLSELCGSLGWGVASNPPCLFVSQSSMLQGFAVSIWDLFIQRRPWKRCPTWPQQVHGRSAQYFHHSAGTRCDACTASSSKLCNHTSVCKNMTRLVCRPSHQLAVCSCLYRHAFYYISKCRQQIFTYLYLAPWHVLVQTLAERFHINALQSDQWNLLDPHLISWLVPHFADKETAPHWHKCTGEQLVFNLHTRVGGYQDVSPVTGLRLISLQSCTVCYCGRLKTCLVLILQVLRARQCASITMQYNSNTNFREMRNSL